MSSSQVDQYSDVSHFGSLHTSNRVDVVDLNNLELALNLPKRGNLPGAENLLEPLSEFAKELPRMWSNITVPSRSRNSMQGPAKPFELFSTGRLLGAYNLGVATLRALVHAGDKTSGDARSWYMINGDAKSWVVIVLHIFNVTLHNCPLLEILAHQLGFLQTYKLTNIIVDVSIPRSPNVSPNEMPRLTI
ncbi:hypothetical protein Tco_0700824, partial [Tanacetum coccineum]